MRLRLWRCRAAGRGRIRVRLVVHVEHVDTRLAAVPEICDRVGGGERAEVDVALCERSSRREGAHAERDIGCNRHEVLPPVTTTTITTAAAGGFP